MVIDQCQYSFVIDWLLICFVLDRGKAKDGDIPALRMISGFERVILALFYKWQKDATNSIIIMMVMMMMKNAKIPGGKKPRDEAMRLKDKGGERRNGRPQPAGCLPLQYLVPMAAEPTSGICFHHLAQKASLCPSHCPDHKKHTLDRLTEVLPSGGTLQRRPSTDVFLQTYL